jgi:hypothetical protein
VDVPSNNENHEEPELAEVPLVEHPLQTYELSIPTLVIKQSCRCVSDVGAILVELVSGNGFFSNST